MFDTMLAVSGSRARRLRNGLSFSLSVLVHATAIAAVIVVPLLRAEADLPGFAVIDAALLAPPVLPGPPPGPGRSGRTPAGPAGPAEGPKPPPPAMRPRGFLAPVEIPTGISEEDPSTLAPDGTGGPGVDGGVGDGSKPWILGEDFTPETIDGRAVAIAVIKPPRLVRRVSPVYPPAAIAAHVSGPVVIAAVTDIYGRVREARVVSGHGLLAMSALEAVREWVYEPSLVNGIPRPVSFTVTVTFTLEKR